MDAAGYRNDGASAAPSTSSDAGTEAEQGARQDITVESWVPQAEDEASLWLDGPLHQAWFPFGVQPPVRTYGLRRAAPVSGAVAVHDASFTYQFADVFNGHTFHQFVSLWWSDFSQGLHDP